MALFLKISCSHQKGVHFFFEFFYFLENIVLSVCVCMKIYNGGTGTDCSVMHDKNYLQSL